MSYLSIRNMNNTIEERQHIRDEQLKDLPPLDRPIYYWHFEKKNGKGWKVQRDFVGSARAAGKLFQRHFGPGFRMRRVSSYQTETRTHDLTQEHVDRLAASTMPPV